MVNEEGWEFHEEEVMENGGSVSFGRSRRW